MWLLQLLPHELAIVLYRSSDQLALLNPAARSDLGPRHSSSDARPARTIPASSPIAEPKETSPASVQVLGNVLYRPDLRAFRVTSSPLALSLSIPSMFPANHPR